MPLADRLRERGARARSRLEALLSIGSGVVAEPAAGVAGLAGLLTGGLDQGVRNIEGTREALTYQPRDPSSLQAIGRAVEPVMSRIEAGKRYLGDRTLEATGSPAAATAAYVAPEALASLLGLRGAGMRGPSMQQMAERSAGPVPGSPAGQTGAIGAWHGSPHDFDRFSMDKLGAGEGAAAYGHGLYFAGNRGTADFYRKKLSGSREDFDGQISPDLYDAIEAEGRLGFDHPSEVVAALRSHPDWQDRWDPQDPARLKSAFEAHEARKYAGRGRLYDVELAPDEADLLDWDAPLHQQPERVRKALDEFGWTQDDMTGGEFYRALGFDYAPSPAEASKRLRELGIPGIRYLDAGSRDAGQGSRNYVIFDDSLVKILGKE